MGQLLQLWVTLVQGEDGGDLANAVHSFQQSVGSRLRADHDLVVVDCIEFNERFRFADPVADMAFLVMDFAFHGRRDQSPRLVTDSV